MKVRLKTDLKGNQLWKKGEIFTSPLPSDIESMILDPRVLEILEPDEVVLPVKTLLKKKK